MSTTTITTPTARLILPADAPEGEWLAARRTGITASEIAVIMGISPFGSPFNLFWKKLGMIPDDFDNTAMSLGRHLEPWIVDQWAADHPEFVVRPSGLYVNGERPWQMATPDRDLYYAQSTSVQSVLEAKSSGTYDGWGDDGSDDIPAYYRAQVLWQLDTLGLSEAHVTCFFLGTRSRRDYTVLFDLVDVELMRKAAEEFRARLEAKDCPPVDGHKATASAIKALHPLLDEDAVAEIPKTVADEYRAARAALKGAEEAADLAENRLRQAMGDAKRAEDTEGGKVASRSIYDRSGVDAKKLRVGWPDVYDACKTTSIVDRLNPSRAKKEAA